MAIQAGAGRFTREKRRLATGFDQSGSAQESICLRVMVRSGPLIFLCTKYEKSHFGSIPCSRAAVGESPLPCRSGVTIAPRSQSKVGYCSNLSLREAPLQSRRSNPSGSPRLAAAGLAMTRQIRTPPKFGGASASKRPHRRLAGGCLLLGRSFRQRFQAGESSLEVGADHFVHVHEKTGCLADQAVLARHAPCHRSLAAFGLERELG